MKPLRQIFLLIAFSQCLFAQPFMRHEGISFPHLTHTTGSAITRDSIRAATPNYKARQIILGSVSAVLTASSLVYLNQAWYKQYSSSPFHFFNDNAEWLQMDKCGHAFTTYQTGRLMMDAIEWAGGSRKSVLLLGGLSGLGYMTAIEVMDGYSSAWGFSWGDMTANAVGSGIAIAQKMVWGSQRIQLKFSYIASDYAQYRPDELGSSFSERILKDYNAQTYWLSVNIASFLKKDTKFPKWINVALGYGANGMIGARYNNIVVQDAQGNTKTFERYRQCYLSLDVDLTRIKTRSRFLKTVFSCVNILKVPFPNIELSRGQVRGNWF